MSESTSGSIRVIGFDPGKTTGVATIEITDRKIKPVFIGSMNYLGDRTQTEVGTRTLKEVQAMIREADYVVIEDFKLRPEVAKAGRLNFDDMPASTVIGRLKTLADLEEKPWVLQQPAEKPAAYGLSGMTYRKGKAGMHSQDALAHAVLFAVKKLKALPIERS